MPVTLPYFPVPALVAPVSVEAPAPMNLSEPVPDEVTPVSVELPVPVIAGSVKVPLPADVAPVRVDAPVPDIGSSIAEIGNSDIESNPRFAI